MSVYSRNVHGCPGIASAPKQRWGCRGTVLLPHPQAGTRFRAVYYYDGPSLEEGYGMNSGFCRGTVLLPASFRAVYPAAVCFHSICELALSLRQHKLAKPRPGRWPISAHRQGAQTVLKARLAKSSCWQQNNNRGVHWNQTLEVERGKC